MYLFHDALMFFAEIRVIRMKIKLSRDRLLYYMLSLTLLIDFLNGLFAGYHIGVIFRAFLMIICLSIIVRYSSKTMWKCLFVFLFLLMNISISTLLFKSRLGVDVSATMKSVMVFIVSNAIIISYDRYSKINPDKIIVNNLTYAGGLFLVTYLLGIGNSSYYFAGSNMGSKGAFLSLNSINIALLILYIFAVVNFVCSNKKAVWGLACIYVALPMLLLGTKTSLIMTIVVPMIVLVINTRKKNTWAIILVLTIMALMCGNMLWNRIYPMIEATLNRQLYLFQQRDLVTYIFSTRNLRVGETLNYFFDNFSILDIFPGRGYYRVHEYIGRGTVIPIEMDWVDILVSYGLLGFVYTYFYSIKSIIKYRSIVKTTNGQAYILAAILIIIYGSLAGHLFLEAISSTFYAVVIAGCHITFKKNRSQTSNCTTEKRTIPNMDKHEEAKLWLIGFH